jgi:hypothetical protein
MNRTTFLCPDAQIVPIYRPDTHNNAKRKKGWSFLRKPVLFYWVKPNFRNWCSPTNVYYGSVLTGGPHDHENSYFRGDYM